VDGELLYEDFLTATLTDGGHFRAAVKAPAADPDIGMTVFLVPYAPNNDDGQPVLTGAPFADAPLLALQMFRGDLQMGRTVQTVNELDTSALEPAGGAALREGGEVHMGDGVVIRFVELRRWVGFQVSARPQIPYLLLASGMLLAGLWPALYAYRRRLWVVATRDPLGGPTLVTVAGRAFQRPQAFEDEHSDVVERLARRLDATRLDHDAPDAAAPSPVTADTAPPGDPGSGADT
ncbi:MAG: cytochrome c biogenesis protein ResB, partial [Trueperaceae bacterium]